MKRRSKYKITFMAVSVLIFISGVFSQKPEESKEKYITICHLTKKFQVESITIPYASLDAHLQHGDLIGECSSSNLPLKISLDKSDVKCNGANNGFIDLNIYFSHGNPPMAIEWSNGESSEDMANLSAGIYSVTVSVSNNLSATASISINEPEPLLIDFSAQNISCAEKNDGKAVISAKGGVSPHSISWSENAGQQSGSIAYNLPKGIYRATVTDANRCSAIADINIDEPAPLNVSVYSTNESCSGNDGNAMAAISGGTPPYAYQWDANANSQTESIATGLKEGDYSILIKDKNGCSASGNINVNKDACGCQLRKEDCGATVVSLGQFIYCNSIEKASNYQWEFSNSQMNFLKTIQRNNSLNNFFLTWVPGIQYGKTYDVRIKPLVNGIWQDYGPVCQITVPAPIPYTKVRNADCGISTTSLNQQLFCDAVAGAQNFQWEFSNSESGFYKIINRGSNSLSFMFGWVTGIQYGKTYEVRVRANVGGEWGNFGNVCQISLVYPIPTTKVRFADCGTTLTSFTQNIFCDAVAGATDYQWEISNADLNFLTTMNRNSTNTNFQLGWISGMQYETAYNVRVKAKVAGEWAEFGFSCQITTPNASINPRIGNSDDNEIKKEIIVQKERISVYPNPSRGEIININLNKENGSKNISVELYDMLGNKISVENSNNFSGNASFAQINKNGELARGIYLLNVSADGVNYTEKIIVK